MISSIDYIIDKAVNGELLDKEEIAKLFSVELFTPEAARIQLASRAMSLKANHGKAEVHAQVGLNIAPCPKDCLFCSFAVRNKIFKERIEYPLEAVVAASKQFEADGANAVYLLTTANYAFEQFIETAQEVRAKLKPETVMVANIADLNREQAQKIKAAGFTGIYHALRLGEGKVTRITPEERMRTFNFAKESGLSIGTCVEPVGPEHSIEELVDVTVITRDIKPGYSGSARRIPIPGTEMAALGIVSEARMAHILAVVRLGVGYDVPGNCTHEPNVIGAAAGANLFWAEAGSNPRDTGAETEKHRGMTVKDCQRIFAEAEWEVLVGPSTMLK